MRDKRFSFTACFLVFIYITERARDGRFHQIYRAMAHPYSGVQLYHRMSEGRADAIRSFSFSLQRTTLGFVVHADVRMLRVRVFVAEQFYKEESKRELATHRRCDDEGTSSLEFLFLGYPSLTWLTWDRYLKTNLKGFKQK